MAGERRAEVVLDVAPHAREQPEPLVADADLPFRILVLADLRGSTTDRSPLRERRPVRIDRDDFDDVLERLQPRIELPLDGSEAARVTIRIRDLDDFHPDGLYASLPFFATLRELRARLENPRTAAQAARELMGEGAEAQPRRPAPGSVLDSILGETDGGGGAVSGPGISISRDPFQQFIQSIVAPHRAADAIPGQKDLLERVDRVATPLMRATLHNPGFRAVEAAWRAIHLMVRRIETDPSLSIWLLDVTREELDADLIGGSPVEESALFRMIVDRGVGTPGAAPWSLLIGDLTFGPDAADVRLLSAIATVARAAGAPFLAAAHPRLAGAPAFDGEVDPAAWQTVAAPEWAAFRRTREARFAGLILPRFLVRLPWGANAEPCDAFEFEEVDVPPRHESLLWANPAFACAILLAESFSAAGWRMKSAFDPELAGLPLHIFHAPGEATAQPCAETLLTERAAGRLLELGLMPLASIRDRDTVRLVRLQSVADPPAPLSGRWQAGP